MIYYFKCEYCQQKVGVVIPESPKTEHVKMDCIYCGAPLPTPTITSESPRRERRDAGFYTGSSGFYIPMVTTTGEYIGSRQYMGRYMGEPIYNTDPNYEEIIRNANYFDISTGL